MIKRLRPKPTIEQMSLMYPVPHNHAIYGRGHQERVDATIDLARRNLPTPVISVADLSCGNAHIAQSLQPTQVYLGDFAVGYEYCGMIEDTILEVPAVQVFICSETLEHVSLPDELLYLIQKRAAYLVLSTPLECWDDTNAEHLWAWDREGVEEMLVRNRWHPKVFTSVDSREYGEPYLYGIWVCA